jgi:hypothetical protein
MINQGIRNGSWIDTTLGSIGASLDALALVSDPGVRGATQTVPARNIKP